MKIRCCHLDKFGGFGKSFDSISKVKGLLFNKLLNWWAATVLPLSHITTNWSTTNSSPPFACLHCLKNIYKGLGLRSEQRIKHRRGQARSTVEGAKKKKKIPSSAAANGHDIAQETVIELIQREADEKVSSLRRYWRGGKEGNNRRSPEWACMKIAPDTIRLRFNLQKKSIRAQTRCPVLIETTCRVFTASFIHLIAQTCLEAEHLFLRRRRRESED